MPTTPVKPIWVMTGVSRGIGRAIAELLIPRFNIVAFVRKPTGLPIVEIQCDLANPISEKVLAQLDSVLNEQSVCGFLHCAGILGLPQQTAEFSVSPLVEAMQVNVFSAIEITERIIPLFRKCRKEFTPCVMHLSTGAAVSPYVGLENYCISKSAALMYFRTLAARFSSAELSVLSIAPGITETDMLAQIMELDSSVLTSKDWFFEAQKTGVVHSAKDIATVIVDILCGTQRSCDKIHGKLLDFLIIHEPYLYLLNNESPQAWYSEGPNRVAD